VSEVVSYDDQLVAAAAELERLVGRLALFSPRSWRTYRAAVMSLLAALVAACNRQQRATLSVPDVPDHALADATTVIGREVLDTLAASPDGDLLGIVRAAIGEALTATR
jgi:hypothetical protein